MTLIFIGTQGDGPDQGIHAAHLDEESGTITPLGLVAVVERPTCVIANDARTVLYAVSEVGNAGDRIGEVLNFAVEHRTGALSPISRTPSGGGGPTHLALDPENGTIFIANFGGGQVSVIRAAMDGTLGPVSSTRTGVGSGPHRRQKSPHAHGVTLAPSGRFLLAPDMGTDRVYIYPYDRAGGTLGNDGGLHVAIPAGSGPRLVLFGNDGRFAYLLTELSAEIYAFSWNNDDGCLTPVGSWSLDGAEAPDNPSAAGFVLSADGRFLYATNRRTHTIHVFAIDPDNGRLTVVQTVPAGGEKPWAIEIAPSGRWLLAANQGSDMVATFAVDMASGCLTAMPGMLQVPCPTGLALIPT
jgi:6-phosphogluconolactonase